MIFSWAIAAATGADGIWGDALPYVCAFWIGLLLLVAGGLVVLVTHRKSTRGPE